MPELRNPGLTWGSIDGDSLISEYESSRTLTQVLPAVAGIYLWRLKLRPSCNIHDKAAIIAHVERVASLPQGRVKDLAMSRSLRLDEMTFGGSGLPRSKVQVLQHLVSSDIGVRLLWDFLADMEDRMPALYVGESGRLPQRIVDHMAGRTEFGLAMSREPDLTWSDLTLEYVKTGSASDEQSQNRRALEYLATVLTISNYTQRAG